MSYAKIYPGNTFPNLGGLVWWNNLVELTDATARIFVEGKTASPFYGAVVISDRIENSVKSSFVFTYDVTANDSILGEYPVLLEVTLSTGEIETISVGKVLVTTEI